MVTDGAYGDGCGMSSYTLIRSAPGQPTRWVGLSSTCNTPEQSPQVLNWVEVRTAPPHRVVCLWSPWFCGLPTGSPPDRFSSNHDMAFTNDRSGFAPIVSDSVNATRRTFSPLLSPYFVFWTMSRRAGQVLISQPPPQQVKTTDQYQQVGGAQAQLPWGVDRVHNG